MCFKIVKKIFRNKQGKKYSKKPFLCIQKNLAKLVAFLKKMNIWQLCSFPSEKTAQLFFFVTQQGLYHEKVHCKGTTVFPTTLSSENVAGLEAI